MHKLTEGKRVFNSITWVIGVDVYFYYFVVVNNIYDDKLGALGKGDFGLELARRAYRGFLLGRIF